MKQIERIVEIVKTGSISKAAQSLSISQPNLSLSVQSLEAELGKTIFLRSRKGMVLTSFGKEFLQYASSLYNQFTAFSEICENLTTEANSNLFISSIALKYVSDLFLEFCQKHKDQRIHFSYMEDSADRVLESVSTQESEIGFIGYTSLETKTWQRLMKQKDVQYFPLIQQEPCILVGEKNPYYWKDVEELELSSMHEFPFIQFLGEIPMHSLWGQKARDIEPPKSVIVVRNRASFYDLLADTDSYCIASGKLNPRVQSGLERVRSIPLKDPGFHYEIGWIKHNDAVLSPIAKEFVKDIELATRQDPQIPKGKVD